MRPRKHRLAAPSSIGTQPIAAPRVLVSAGKPTALDDLVLRAAAPPDEVRVACVSAESAERRHPQNLAEPRRGICASPRNWHEPPRIRPQCAPATQNGTGGDAPPAAAHPVTTPECCISS
jgi:hypothetical protein